MLQRPRAYSPADALRPVGWGELFVVVKGRRLLQGRGLCPERHWVVGPIITLYRTQAEGG